MSETKKKACGDMHKGGYTGFLDSCPHCLKANKMPTHNALTIDLAHANAKLEAAESENKYLKAQLTQCRGAGAELELVELKLTERQKECVECVGLGQHGPCKKHWGSNEP